MFCDNPYCLTCLQPSETHSTMHSSNVSLRLQTQKTQQPLAKAGNHTVCQVPATNRVQENRFLRACPNQNFYWIEFLQTTVECTLGVLEQVRMGFDNTHYKMIGIKVFVWRLLIAHRTLSLLTICNLYYIAGFPVL
ncbi:hypothetical protein KIL84_008604 [Mauremys mutica]|uniref:Uncharacterized protein n=1 Tax=Mauremys mutica TaxID=74926 RepID=A0A9D4AXW9_9SAUR|nr:hypothetical protein KIL84_008604 [Mauremys mutica]